MAWLRHWNVAFGTSLRFVLPECAGLSDLRGSGVLTKKVADQFVMVMEVIAGKASGFVGLPWLCHFLLCTSSDTVHGQFIPR